MPQATEIKVIRLPRKAGRNPEEPMAPHQPTATSDTLSATSPVAEASDASAEPSAAPTQADGSCYPPPITDQFSRDWVWSAVWECYRYDTETATLLRDPAEVCGNIFEWAWTYSRADGPAREVLLFLTFNDLSHWPGYAQLASCLPPDADLDDVAAAVLELAALGELDLHGITADTDLSQACETVSYGFPAYQAWCAQQAPVVTE
jgi:hypothetical protein